MALYYGVVVPQDAVMYTLMQIDPKDSNNQRAHKLKWREYRNAGANSCWYLNGYDKLKPFGFPIHGCINGYSRKIIWLKAVHSNKFIPFYYFGNIFRAFKAMNVAQAEFTLIVVVKT